MAKSASETRLATIKLRHDDAVSLIELALHKDSLATIDFGRGQKIAARVRIDAQKMRYLVRSTEWRIGNDSSRPEGKRE
jgi:hypothetical protein